MSEQSPTLAARKAALRRDVLAARSALPAAARHAASAAITERLRSLPRLDAARAVGGYAAFGSEASIDAYLADCLAEGVGVFLPWVDGDELHMARIADLDGDVAPGFRGVREPRAAGRLPARVDRLHALLVPAVAFDRDGGRLGYGGGHYDRLLARLGPATLVIGVAFDVQVVDAVPVAAHDHRVDFVVTEHEVIAAPRSSEAGGRASTARPSDDPPSSPSE